MLRIPTKFLSVGLSLHAVFLPNLEKAKNIDERNKKQRKPITMLLSLSSIYESHESICARSSSFQAPTKIKKASSKVNILSQNHFCRF